MNDQTLDRRTWYEALLWQVIAAALRKLNQLSPPVVSFKVSFGSVRLKKGIIMQLQKQITNEQEIDITLTPMTGGPNPQPVPVDGAIAWEVLDGNSTLTNISEDGKTATLRSEDGLGVTRFKATGDADLGSGVVEVSLEVELTVVGAQAQTLGGAFGDPRNKTP